MSSTTSYSSINGFLINDKTKVILENLVIEGIQYYPSQLLSENDNIPYWYAYFIPAKDMIDFEKSKFIVHGFYDKENTEEIKIISFDDFRSQTFSLANDSKMMTTLNIVLKEELDMFLFPFSSDYYVSDKLREELGMNDITGILFKEIKTEISVVK